MYSPDVTHLHVQERKLPIQVLTPLEASVDLNGMEGNGRFPEIAEWPESGSYADLGKL